MSNDGRTWTLGALAALTAGAALLKKAQGSMAVGDDDDESETLEQLMSSRAAAHQGGVKLTPQESKDLSERARAAYDWITQYAVYCPVGDMEFGGRASEPLHFSEAKETSKQQLWLPPQTGAGEAYCSFVLLPLLNLFAQRRALMIGGPGRSKTTIAFVLAGIAGISNKDIKRFIVRGHPQLTITDMIGATLPSKMMSAQKLKDVQVSWKDWITARIKIIDEYNRIPTKTQSALLSLMAEGEAEQFDQFVTTRKQKTSRQVDPKTGKVTQQQHPGSGKHGGSWFLTANDDKGGGTFEVIEALKDRIDIVVRAVPFHSSFTSNLLDRIESGKSPEKMIPVNIRFTIDELDRISDRIDAIKIPKDIVAKLGFFMGQLDFCRKASPTLEAMNKDSLKLVGKTVGSVCNETCPLDKKTHLCTQTEGGLSARSFETILRFSKTLAWFRGREEVSWEDIAQILPWTVRDKLQPNAKSAFFAGDNEKFLLDKTAWIENMLRMNEANWVQHRPVREHVIDLEARYKQVQMEPGKFSETEIKSRSKEVYDYINAVLTKADLSGWIYEDVLECKRIIQDYQAILRRKK